jgi:hypothetical protein
MILIESRILKTFRLKEMDGETVFSFKKEISSRASKTKLVQILILKENGLSDST